MKKVPPTLIEEASVDEKSFDFMTQMLNAVKTPPLFKVVNPTSTLALTLTPSP